MPLTFRLGFGVALLCWQSLLDQLQPWRLALLVTTVPLRMAFITGAQIPAPGETWTQWSRAGPASHLLHGLPWPHAGSSEVAFQWWGEGQGQGVLRTRLNPTLALGLKAFLWVSTQELQDTMKCGWHWPLSAESTQRQGPGLRHCTRGPHGCSGSEASPGLWWPSPPCRSWERLQGEEMEGPAGTPGGQRLGCGR